MTSEKEMKFGEAWIAAWNTHDIKKLMGQCAKDIELSSPLVVDSGASADGIIKGRDAVGEFWTKTLMRVPGSRLELVDVLSGIDSRIVIFRTPNGGLGAHVLHFRADGKIVRAGAHFAL
jgi:hypothetical protein